MEKMLKEILTKIDFIMSNTYLNEENTIMDLYNEKNISSNNVATPIVPIPTYVDTLLEFAHKTGKFIINVNRDFVIVDHPSGLYKISYERFVNGK
jgi:flagellar biosynthesis protein FliP